jgi:hypothetical protein
MSRLLRVVAVLVLSIAALLQGPGSAQGASFQAVLRYSAKPQERLMSLPIATLDAHGTYEVSLVPEVDTDQHVVVLDLVLGRRGEKADTSRNLFYPPGTNWHGLQPWIFGASDFRRGIAKSINGASRYVHVEYRGIVVQIDVLKADILPVRGKDFSSSFASFEVAVRIRSAR